MSRQRRPLKRPQWPAPFDRQVAFAVGGGGRTLRSDERAGIVEQRRAADGHHGRRETIAAHHRELGVRMLSSPPDAEDATQEFLSKASCVFRPSTIASADLTTFDWLTL
jgi:hypothetical protein